MLQPLTARNEDKPLDLAQSSASLGQPASMLPFLAAQASSVFPGTSESQGTVPLAFGGAPTSGVPEGLDLGNGWKVVGLTSLAGLTPLPTPTLGQCPQDSAVNSACSASSGDEEANRLITPLSGEAAGVNKRACIVKDPLTVPSLGPGEWKVVGLTSLNPENSSIVCNSQSTIVPPQNMTVSDTVSTASCGINFCLRDLEAKQTEQREQTVLTNNSARMSSAPALSDVTSEPYEWKVAGITTMVQPVEASMACGSMDSVAKPASAATPVALPLSTLTPEMAMQDSAEWKVVGVTSLSSPPVNSAPVMASSNPPLPLVMASAPPGATVPMSPPTTSDMVWKVVGMVPLPQHSETPPKEMEPSAHSKREIFSSSELSDQIQGNGYSSKEESPAHCTRSCDKEDEYKTWTSSKMAIESRKWASRSLHRHHEDPSHPLGFLKNCSTRFRNAVLKRNTVSTMLELKRAYKNVEKRKKLLSFMERMNHLSPTEDLMYFVLKRLSNPKSAKSKSVECDCFTMDSSDELCDRSHHEKITDRSSGVDHDQDGTIDTKPLSSIPSSAGQMMLVDCSTAHPLADDKLALSLAYGAQIESEKFQEMHGTSPSVSPHKHSRHQTREGNRASMKTPSSFSDASLNIINNDDDQSLKDLSSDAVNITSIDPWGVCTSDDLGEIADMVTDMEQNKFQHSSSRKRKLSTPRKMIQ